METVQKADLRDSLAAERTFLAWIRTGLALTGFGFVVARFGPYLRDFQFGAPSGDVSHGMSLLFGTALIAVGVVVYLLSAWHHFKLVKELERGAPPPSRPSIQAIAIALFLALVGIGMAIYLLSIRHSANMHVGGIEDSQGRVWASYNSCEYLGLRHGLPGDLLQNIAVVETLATKAAE